jgi:hypothetical protein
MDSSETDIESVTTQSANGMTVAILRLRGPHVREKIPSMQAGVERIISGTPCPKIVVMNFLDCNVDQDFLGWILVCGDKFGIAGIDLHFCMTSKFLLVKSMLGFNDLFRNPFKDEAEALAFIDRDASTRA